MVATLNPFINLAIIYTNTFIQRNLPVFSSGCGLWMALQPCWTVGALLSENAEWSAAWRGASARRHARFGSNKTWLAGRVTWGAQAEHICV